VATNIIGMYGPITGGTENAIATITLPQTGHLIGIDWDVHVTLDAAEFTSVELSFIATALLLVNDARGRISSMGISTAAPTLVGFAPVTLQKWLGPFDLAVSSGERIYIHASSTAGVTGSARCNLYMDFVGGAPRRSARRRQ